MKRLNPNHMQTLTRSKKTQAAQVYFPVDVYFEIKQVALKENKPIAQWIRDVVIKEMETKSKKKFTTLPKFSWGKKKSNLSEKIDEIIYGNT